MKRPPAAAVSLLFALMFGGSAFAQLSGSHSFGGSTTIAPIANAAIEEFQKANPGLQISYEALGSAAGLKALLDGEISLAGSSVEWLATDMKGAKATAIALDGLSVVVNRNIRLSTIALADLARIFHGDIVNWKELGAQDQRIVVINRDESSGSYDSFWEMVCQPTLGKRIAYTRDVIVTKENGEVAAKVASTPGSIGYVGMGFADQVIKAGGRRLMINGVADTLPNVVSKKYPLARSLFILTRGEPASGTVEKAFLDFILSPRGQAIVKSVDYIPVPKKLRQP